MVVLGLIKKEIMSKEIRKIVLPTKERLRIAKIFGVSLASVSNALRYITMSERAERMRRMALELGGIEMTEVPVFDTMFKTADGIMTQILANGIRLEVYLKSKEVLVYDGKTLVGKYSDVDLPTLAYIQAVESQRPVSSAGLCQ